MDPKLSKAELAALDLIIENLKENPDLEFQIFHSIVSAVTNVATAVTSAAIDVASNAITAVATVADTVVDAATDVSSTVVDSAINAIGDATQVSDVNEISDNKKILGKDLSLEELIALRKRLTK